MRFAKLFALSVLFMFLLLTGIGLLFPSTVRVSRTITINQNSKQIQPLLADMKQWKTWLPEANDKNIVFKGAATSGEGAVALVGKSEVKITEASDSLVRSQWHDESNHLQLSEMRLYPSGQTTTFNWTFTQQLAWYPWERFASMMNDKILGPLMEQSMANIKQQAEQR